ncbi:MAG: HIG1 domain-containing protein [Pseudomonadota bacterium]
MNLWHWCGNTTQNAIYECGVPIAVSLFFQIALFVGIVFKGYVGMSLQQILFACLYVGAAALLVVLLLGVVNLTRTDARQASRSNLLMRWRIGVQAICVLLLVILGFVAGSISFGG